MKKRTKRMLVDGLSILMSLTGGVLYFAHDIVAMPMIPASWSDKWAAVVILSGVLHKAGQSIISYLEPEKPNASRANNSAHHVASNNDSTADDTGANESARDNGTSLSAPATDAKSVSVAARRPTGNAPPAPKSTSTPAAPKP